MFDVVNRSGFGADTIATPYVPIDGSPSYREVVRVIVKWCHEHQEQSCLDPAEYGNEDIAQTEACKIERACLKYCGGIN